MRNINTVKRTDSVCRVLGFFMKFSWNATFCHNDKWAGTGERDVCFDLHLFLFSCDSFSMANQAEI